MSSAVLSPWRADIVTGSRLPAIMELSPYNTRDQVLRQMVRDYFDEPEEFTGNIATEWGQEHEADGIAEYEMITGATVTKTGQHQQLVMHPRVHDLGVTPDGRIGTVGVIQIKAPFRALYSHISERPDYEVQLRLEMDCAGAEWGDFGVWRPNSNLSISRLAYDPDWLPSVLPVVEEFMAEYRDIIAHPVLAAKYRAPLVDQRTDKEWLRAEADYLDCLTAKAAAEKQVEAAKAALVALVGLSKSTRGHRVLLTRSEPKGTIAYKTAVETLNPGEDLERFRSAPRGEPTFTARLIKEKAA